MNLPLTSQEIARESLMILSHLIEGDYHDESVVCLYCRSVGNSKFQNCANCGASAREISNFQPVGVSLESGLAARLTHVRFALDVSHTLDEAGERVLRPAAHVLYNAIKQWAGTPGPDMVLVFAPLQPLQFAAVSYEARSKKTGVSLRYSVCDEVHELAICYGLASAHDAKGIVRPRLVLEKAS